MTSKHLSATQIIKGRVFSRLNQFHALPEALKDEVASLEKHLTTIQNEVFAKHHTLQLKSVRGVRYKPLLDTVYEWVVDQESPKAPPMVGHKAPEVVGEETTTTDKTSTTTAASEQPPSSASVPADTSGEAATAAATPNTPAVPSTMEEISLASDEEAEAKRSAEEAAKSSRVAHAKKLIDALVLKGFITPNKEDKSAIPTNTEEFEFKDLDLLVPLATAITGLTIPTTTVWDLVDGTVFAAPLKRRAGLLAPLTSGKDVYVLVNVRAHSVTLFESDVAREPIRIFEAALANVTHDKTHYDHGVKLWDETDAELFNMASVSERDSFVAALEAVGVTFREQFPIPDHHAQPANFITSHTYTVDEVTEAAADAVPLDDVSDKFKTHVPAHTEPSETTTTEKKTEKHEPTGEGSHMAAASSETTAPMDSDSQEWVVSHESQDLSRRVAFQEDHKTHHSSEKTETTQTTPVEDDHNRNTTEESAAIPTRPRTQSIDYGKPTETTPAALSTTTTTPTKHDETLSSSPTESPTATTLFGERSTGDVSAQKADKVFRFEDTTPTKTERAPLKSNYFGHSTVANDDHANGNDANADHANATKPTTPAP